MLRKIDENHSKYISLSAINQTLIVSNTSICLCLNKFETCEVVLGPPGRWNRHLVDRWLYLLQEETCVLEFLLVPCGYRLTAFFLVPLHRYQLTSWNSFSVRIRSLSCIQFFFFLKFQIFQQSLEWSQQLNVSHW